MRIWLVHKEDVEKAMHWLNEHTREWSVDKQNYQPLVVLRVLPDYGSKLLAWLKSQNVMFLSKSGFGLDKAQKIGKPRKEPFMERWRGNGTIDL